MLIKTESMPAELARQMREDEELPGVRYDLRRRLSTAPVPPSPKFSKTEPITPPDHALPAMPLMAIPTGTPPAASPAMMAVQADAPSAVPMAVPPGTPPATPPAMPLLAEQNEQLQQQQQQQRDRNDPTNP